MVGDGDGTMLLLPLAVPLADKEFDCDADGDVDGDVVTVSDDVADREEEGEKD